MYVKIRNTTVFVNITMFLELILQPGAPFNLNIELLEVKPLERGSK